jgi:MFS family permease
MSGSHSDEKGSVHGSEHAVYQRPTGIKGIYTHPLTQVCILGFVCFMCPGLFNALNGLGAGGQVDSKTGSNANVALYSTFAAVAFFAGSINNTLGPRLTLLLGTTGYALYIGSWLATNIHPGAGAFVIAAGAILGVCAGLLWTAQGSLMMAYPTEGQKGLFIAVFWAIFNLGGVVGASVAVGQNIHSTANAVGNGTYIGFLILTCLGVFLPMIMTNPNNMIRTDGTKVTAPRHPSWKTEIYGLWLTLKTDQYIILLFPLFFASNWFTTWQFNNYNGAIFNIRTRSLNNLLYWIAQIIGALLTAALLDQKKFKRRTRALAGWVILFIFVFFTHIWAYFYQKEYTRGTSYAAENNRIDFKDPIYVGHCFLYIFLGMMDAMWQSYAYWIMGAMSNDPAKLAHFAGFYKSLQSAGAAGAWRADAVKIPYMNLLISTWTLLVAGLIFALPVLWYRVHDTTDIAEEVLARMDDEGHVHGPQEVHHIEEEKEKA